MQTTANKRAPVLATAEIEISARPETVWDILTDFRRWPDWNPDVKAMSVDGPVAPGTEFNWRAGATIRSRLERVEQPALIAWSGRTLGVRALHTWRIESRDGAARVSTEESWEGLLPNLLRGPMRRMLRKSLESGLQHLKAEAERRERRG